MPISSKLLKKTNYYQLRSNSLVLPPITNSISLDFSFDSVLSQAIGQRSGANQPFIIESVLMDIPQLRGVNILDKINATLKFSSYNIANIFLQNQADLNVNIPKLAWELNTRCLVSSINDPFDFPSAFKFAIDGSINVLLDGRYLPVDLEGELLNLDIYCKVTNYGSRIG